MATFMPVRMCMRMSTQMMSHLSTLMPTHRNTHACKGDALVDTRVHTVCPYIHSYTHAKFGQGVFRRMDVAAWVYCLSVIAAFIAERVFFFTQPVTATAEKSG